MSTNDAVLVADRCLAVFIDDSGHEEFKGDSIYALAGCAALGRDLASMIQSPWREIRRQVTGSPATPLHASSFSKIATPSNMEGVAKFFCLPFWRIAAMTTNETLLSDQLSLTQTMKAVLQTRINWVVERTLCKEVAVIFEASDRVDNILEKEFQDLSFRRGDKQIPHECYLLEKRHAEPAMEVADFVVHAAGRQARRDLMGLGQRFEKDFAAVFHAHEGQRSSYLRVHSVEAREI